MGNAGILPKDRHQCDSDILWPLQKLFPLGDEEFPYKSIINPWMTLEQLQMYSFKASEPECWRY